MAGPTRLAKLGSLMTTFRVLLKSIMQQRHITQLALGESLGYCRNGYISQVLTGKKAPPLDDIERWADALELSGEERQTLIRAALDDYAPIKRLLADYSCDH